VDLNPLGDSGLEVSRVGLGCNNFGGRIDLGRARGVVDAALDAGITLFDTAHSYGNGRSEEFLGELLAGRRERVVLATKFGARSDDGGGLRKGSRVFMRRSLTESLARLRTDHVDLYYLHFPDSATPLAETLGAMQELVQEGLVRAIGCSNFTAGQLREADKLARISGRSRFAVVQNNYNLLEREAEQDVLPLCRELGIVFIPYFPLASGVLTGKYHRDEAPPAGTRLAGMPPERAESALSPKVFDRVEALDGWARDHGHTLLELAISWLLARPTVASVIAGATRPEQVQANAAAASWRLSDDDLREIDALLEQAKAQETES
jgi:aryl-alcohol dehydrogenase-like predicted oxidoreductase